MDEQADVTTLLGRWRRGDSNAFDQLVPRIYGQLRYLARQAMRGERSNHTLQATALVHEAYLRLLAGSSPRWQDRLHFFAVAARMMRRVLVDHARARSAARRGGGATKVILHDRHDSGGWGLDDLLALDQALAGLERTDPRKVKVIELRFFAGLTVVETARLLEVSVPTVKLDTRLGRAWLYRRLRPGGGRGQR